MNKNQFWVGEVHYNTLRQTYLINNNNYFGQYLYPTPTLHCLYIFFHLFSYNAVENYRKISIKPKTQHKVDST